MLELLFVIATLTPIDVPMPTDAGEVIELDIESAEDDEPEEGATSNSPVAVRVCPSSTTLTP